LWSWAALSQHMCECQRFLIAGLGIGPILEERWWGLGWRGIFLKVWLWRMLWSLEQEAAFEAVNCWIKMGVVFLSLYKNVERYPRMRLAVYISAPRKLASPVSIPSYPCKFSSTARPPKSTRTSIRNFKESVQLIKSHTISPSLVLIRHTSRSQYLSVTALFAPSGLLFIHNPWAIQGPPTPWPTIYTTRL
jgi:hypothetical protein